MLMVDEFQDTSPIQLSLFVKMASLVDKVIWVGDPKQSIYGFRGSDAALIDTVIDNLGTSRNLMIFSKILIARGLSWCNLSTIFLCLHFKSQTRTYHGRADRSAGKTKVK